jgi:hypothetical protein
VHCRVLSLLDPLCVLVPPPAAGGIGALCCVAGCDCSAASNTCIAKQGRGRDFQILGEKSWCQAGCQRNGEDAALSSALNV